MSRTFKHLTWQQRMILSWSLKRGLSKADIAKEMGVHRSTVYRELPRNQDSVHGYFVPLALKSAYERQRVHKLPKFVKDAFLKGELLDGLRKSWSPEQIAGQLRRRFGRTLISHEAIYAYIYLDIAKPERLHGYLRRHRPKRYHKLARKKRSLIPNRVCITQRPPHIASRQTFGEWEADFMLFQKGTKTCLFTLRERKSRFLIAMKSPNRCAETVVKHCQQRFQFEKANVNSITFDNDPGFIPSMKPLALI